LLQSLIGPHMGQKAQQLTLGHGVAGDSRTLGMQPRPGCWGIDDSWTLYGKRNGANPPQRQKRRTLKLRGGTGADPTLTLQQSPARDHPSRCAQRRCANDATHHE
jgi:hypothetical protein